MRAVTFAVTFLMLGSAPAHGDVGAEFVVREVRSGGRVHRFAVWLPAGYDRSRTWPALLFLHGSGECGTDGEAPTRIGLGPALRRHPERWPFVVVFPQKPTSASEWEEHERMVLDVLARARRDYRIDAKRVGLTGVSQGGHGAWMFAARHPAKWRAVAPVCGYGRAATIAPRVAHLPVWAFHGQQDDVVNPHETEEIVAAIRALRAERGLDPDGVRATIFPNANHNSWDPAYAEPELPGWFAAACSTRDDGEDHTSGGLNR